MSSRKLLTIDVGNTALKISVFEGESLVSSSACKDADAERVRRLLDRHSDIAGAVCCRVGTDTRGIVDMIRASFGERFMEIGPSTPVPVTIDYDRNVLGNDRLAAAVGVAQPGRTVLLVDAGTAVTIDMTRDMHYQGGNISPGPRLRFEALNRFTCQLPLVDADGEAPVFGHNTQQAIRSGVMRGLAYEVAGTCREARDLGGSVDLVLTGGYARTLSRYLTIMNISHSIDCEAVGRGLVRIYEYNNDNDSNEKDR